jgi:hypothetical protein
MQEQTRVMRPGILVALKSRVSGGVEYQHSGVEEDEDGKVKRWETTRVMEDPEERKAAGDALQKAVRLVNSLCTRTTFGLLCPVDREAELDAAVVQMREACRVWNAQATYSFIYASAIKGRIADNDEEALRAIVEEATEVLERMDKSLSDADLKQIRKAADDAKALSAMMTPESAGQLTAAYEAARRAARAITKKAGDMDARVADALIEVQQEAFNKARFAFLETSAEAIEALPSVDLNRGAQLEIEDDDDSAVIPLLPGAELVRS